MGPQSRPMAAGLTERSRWELSAESAVVKLRWFGVVMGYILVQTRTGPARPLGGAGVSGARGRLCRARPGVLADGRGLPQTLAAVCFTHGVGLHRDALLSRYGISSPFRWYYLLSLICCSIRYSSAVAWWTFAFHSLSLLALARILGVTPLWDSSLPLTWTIMAWATWACSSLAGSLHAAGQELEHLNAELASIREDLESRVEERTDALRASQARVIHQEKMAAFGLLAAGIAHEVGNPLAALSSLVQILKRRGPDAYTAEKLDLAGRQLQRIERTIRELIDFSRPASTVVSRVRHAEVVDEALGIAKYYQRTKQRSITTDIPADLPAVVGVRDYLTQVVLNLVLNAVDATADQGRIHVAAREEDGSLVLSVEDDGRGISIADRCRLFQPYFTTKAHGTGLGLFVSRQILEDFAGSLAFVSEPGEGSTFVVRLPLERMNNRESRATRPPPIATVEDEPPALIAAAASRAE